MEKPTLNREQASAMAEALLMPERAAQQARAQAMVQREAARLAWRQKVRQRGGVAIAGRDVCDRPMPGGDVSGAGGEVAQSVPGR